MDEMIMITPERIGLLMWIVWGLIGLLAAVVTQRIMPNRQMIFFDIVVGIVAAVLGGFLSVQYIGGTPTMLVLISVLGAIFASGIALWIVGALLIHFSKKP